jgi:hypothetical protein
MWRKTGDSNHIPHFRVDQQQWVTTSETKNHLTLAEKLPIHRGDLAQEQGLPPAQDRGPARVLTRGQDLDRIVCLGLFLQAPQTRGTLTIVVTNLHVTGKGQGGMTIGERLNDMIHVPRNLNLRAVRDPDDHQMLQREAQQLRRPEHHPQ